MKPRIKSIIWNIKKQKTTNQNKKKKKESKKNEDSVSSFGTTSRDSTFSSEGCQKEKKKIKKSEIYMKK